MPALANLRRLLPLFILVLVVAFVTLSCGRDTPPNPPASTPSAVGELLGRPSSNPAIAVDGGFLLATGDRPGRFRSLARPLEMRFPARADGAIDVRIGGAKIGVTRPGIGRAGGILERGKVLYGTSGDDARSIVVAKGDAVEELFVVSKPIAELGYDLALPAGWWARGTFDATRVEIMNAAGTPELRVSTAHAWDRSGAEVEVHIRAEGSHLRLGVDDAAKFPVTIDPDWVDAAVPLKLRTFHTATLLADGRVFVAGGSTSGSFEASTELYDPSSSTSVTGPTLAEARGGHTATLLADGRVLIAGGRGASGVLQSTEIFDTRTGKLAAGPMMSAPRANHTATLLRDGRVLIFGKASAEIFDPTTSTFVTTGQPLVTFFEGNTAARLNDGRVLVVGVTAGNAVAEIFDPAANGGAGAFVNTGAPSTFVPGFGTTTPAISTLTMLRDGRVLLLGGCPCFSVGGPTSSSNHAELFDPNGNGGVGAFTPTGDAQAARLGPSATLLPSGSVLIAGSTDTFDTADAHTAEIFSPQLGTFTSVAAQMNARRLGHTATLLPSGDVLLIGGLQASAELYVGGGTEGLSAPGTSPNLLTGRGFHTATTFAEGRVLFAGGWLAPTPNPHDAEVYDPATSTFSPAGPMVQLRRAHTATLLPDGRILLVGGSDGTTTFASAELFDPQSYNFSATGNLTTARMNAAAVLLPSGKVLVIGGSAGGNRFDSGELYDPVAGTFAAIASKLPAPMGRPGAVVLPNGRVLVVGATSAAIYDPVTNAFSVTGSPGAVRPDVSPYLESDDRVMALGILPSGEAFVLGGDTLAAEIYDPASGTFSFAGPNAQSRVNLAIAVLPTGQVFVSAGNPIAIEPVATGSTQVFDPGGASEGQFFSLPDGAPRAGHTANVLPNGDVLVAGGFSCFAICAPFALNSTERWTSPIASVPYRPVLATAPSPVLGGAGATIAGSGFFGLEAGSGASNGSATTVPIAVWQPLSYPAVLIGTLNQWSDTSASWQVPATAYAGLGWLSVYVDGVPSLPKLVTISPAAQASGCAFDAQCATGHCVDGVCCDSACVGDCQGCSAARKGSGADGVCGPVPPGADPKGLCFIATGASCSADLECTTHLCVDGVCCQTACTGECEACDVMGSLGTCVPAKGKPHGSRPACDATLPTDLCMAKLCDGVDRTQCAGTVGPCTPFACAADSCFHACQDTSQCAAGFHCDAGACVAGQCNGSMATTPNGQIVDCAPYNCQADGTCRTSCASVADCAAPSACNFDGRCVPRPTPDASSGCSCRLSGDAGDAGGAAVLACLAACVAAARRRRLAIALGLGVGIGVAGPRAAFAAPGPASPPADTPSDKASEPTPANKAAAAPDESKKPEALERFNRGIALTGEQKWSSALAEFLESRNLYPTRATAQNIAFCLMSLGRSDEALDAYEALLRDYPKMDEAKQREALKAIVDLKPLVGTIEVDGAEPGASILVDGIQRATFPAAAPIRVIAASHVVRVFKQGFQPFEQRVEVAGRGVGRVDAKLVTLRESGTLKVTDTEGRALAVLVDNVEMGTTPFEGALAVGKHVVVLKGDGQIGTPPTAAPIQVDRTTSLELHAVKLDGALRVEPKPPGALVSIDSVAVGLGTWEGALPSGDHHVEVSADGYHAARRDAKLTAAEPFVLPIALQRDEDNARWKIPAKVVLEASGSFGLFPRYFGDTTDGCGPSCSVGPGLGASALAHFTYELGSGLGFGITGGYLFTTQSVNGRTADVRPVGLPARQGSVSDKVSASGGLAAAHISYHFGEKAPILLRLAVGPWFGEVRDERVGSFPVASGFAYQAGPVMQNPFTVFLAVSPEVRFVYNVTKRLGVSLGLATPVLISLTHPRWDPKKEVDAAVDGIGAFNGENLTGPAWFIVAPSVDARYAF